MQPMAMDWNDLRVLLAVLQHGSTRRAAAVLGVEQTTCARRITALEGALGLKLFERDAGGYHPTPAALALRDYAAAIAEKVAAFERFATAEARRGGGPVRITCEEFFARTVVAHAVRRFSERWPEASIEIDVSREHRDLSGGEADLAVRPGEEPQEPSLIRRKLGEDRWDIYCSHDYAQRHGAPVAPADLGDHAIVCFESVVERTRAAGLGACIRQVSNTVGGTLAIVESGACVGALPRLMAKDSDKLRLCFQLPEAEFAVWLVYPERVRDVPAVRELSRLIGNEYQRRHGDPSA